MLSYLPEAGKPLLGVAGSISCFPQWFAGKAEKGRVDWECCGGEGGIGLLPNAWIYDTRTSRMNPQSVLPRKFGESENLLRWEGGVGVGDGC